MGEVGRGGGANDWAREDSVGLPDRVSFGKTGREATDCQGGEGDLGSGWDAEWTRRSLSVTGEGEMGDTLDTNWDFSRD